MRFLPKPVTLRASIKNGRVNLAGDWDAHTRIIVVPAAKGSGFVAYFMPRAPKLSWNRKAATRPTRTPNAVALRATATKSGRTSMVGDFDHETKMFIVPASKGYTAFFMQRSAVSRTPGRLGFMKIASNSPLGRMKR